MYFFRLVIGVIIVFSIYIYIYIYIYSFRSMSLHHVHCLVQTEFSTQCELVLTLSVSCLFSFL
jgi:hypothetical protein